MIAVLRKVLHRIAGGRAKDVVSTDIDRIVTEKIPVLRQGKSTTTRDPNVLPNDLPVPVDDGRAKHLPGLRWPELALPGTDGREHDLSRLVGRTVVYAYPRTGVPGVPLLPGWDAIPGARGCTPQSCSFRNHFADLNARGVSHVFGLSTNDPAHQLEMATRLHLPFAVLSDEHLALVKALDLPTFTTSGFKLMSRLTMVIDNGIITHVFYPVFPPDRSAQDVVDWLDRVNVRRAQLKT